MRQFIPFACAFAAALPAWGLGPVNGAKEVAPEVRHAAAGTGQFGRIWQPPRKRSKSPGGPPAAVHGISVALVPTGRRFVSGAMLPASVAFRDRSELPFSIVQGLPAYCTLRFGGTLGPHRSALYLTAHGQAVWGPVSFSSLDMPTNTAVVPGGRLALWGQAASERISVGRYLDLTLPGSYHLQVETKYGVRRVPGRLAELVRGAKSRAAKWWVHRKIVNLGRHYALGQGGVRLAPQNPNERLRSNWVKIRILPPYGGQRPTAITPAGAGAPRLAANAKPGLHMILADPDVSGPGPITVRAFFQYTGRVPIGLRLTGDPQLDIAAVKDQEPAGYVLGIRVAKPKPHVVFPKLPPPLTAYGKWLLKHPPKKLPAKLYTLKPGVVYKYAVPINLSCQYDMSLAGTYRVRVELAHPKIWSNWIKVKVPQ